MSFSKLSGLQKCYTHLYEPFLPQKLLTSMNNKNDSNMTITYDQNKHFYIHNGRLFDNLQFF